MKPLEIEVPSAATRVLAFTPDGRMRRIASGRRIAPVLQKARATMGKTAPVLVVVPKRNTTYIF